MLPNSGSRCPALIRCRGTSFEIEKVNHVNTGQPLHFELCGSAGRPAVGRMMKKYVAIVDDDSSFGAYLRTFLSLRGYEARCYTRGDEFLASIKQNEQPDVVLLDVMMPGLDGMATLKALKASRPETQVIMLSGRNQASTIVEAVRLGAADYVVKPDDPEGLGGNRARRRHQECHREKPAGLRAERVAAAVERRRRPDGLGQQRQDARHRNGHRAGGRQRCHRSPPRRERGREGARRRARFINGRPGTTGRS